MEDRLLESTHGGELGVDVKRVVVTAQTVDGCLLLGGLLLDDSVGCALGDGVSGGGGTAVAGLGVAAEAAGPAEEDGHLVVEDVLSGGLVNGGGCRLDDGSGAFVDDFDELGVRHEGGGGGDGVLADLKVLLAVEEHHGVEVGDDGGDVVRGLGGEGGDDAECWEGLEVLRALEDVGKLGAEGADAEVVERDVALLVGEFGAGCLGLLGLFDGGEDLWVGLRLAGGLLGLLREEKMLDMWF